MSCMFVNKTANPTPQKYKKQIQIQIERLKYEMKMQEVYIIFS